MESGVYTITHKPTGMFYIGSSARLKRRWPEHLRALRSSKHSNKKLQVLWDSGSLADFEFSVLKTCPASELLEEETNCIQDKVDSDLMLNKQTVASRTSLGVKFTPETVEKMRLSRLGYKHTDETKEKIRAAQKGRPLQPEHVAALRAKRAEMRANRTECKNGHALTPDNIYVWSGRPDRRGCKACIKINSRNSFKRKQA